MRFRRAMMLPASAGGSTVPVMARLIQAGHDTVRDVIDRFNEVGLSCLGPRWAGRRPRLPTGDDENLVIQMATTRPTRVGQPPDSGPASPPGTTRVTARMHTTQQCPNRTGGASCQAGVLFRT